MVWIWDVPPKRLAQGLVSSWWCYCEVIEICGQCFDWFITWHFIEKGWKVGDKAYLEEVGHCKQALKRYTLSLAISLLPVYRDVSCSALPNGPCHDVGHHHSPGATEPNVCGLKPWENKSFLFFKMYSQVFCHSDKKTNTQQKLNVNSHGDIICNRPKLKTISIHVGQNVAFHTMK
jgi:hypothetical protein